MRDQHRPMDRSNTVLLASLLFSLWACTRDEGAVATSPVAAAGSGTQAAPDASGAGPGTSTPGAAIAVPDKDDATMAARQSPVMPTASDVLSTGPLPEGSDIGYRCEDGGLVRVVYTQSHANLSLDGVFLPLQPWAAESRRTGAEAWEGGHVALVRRGDMVDLREADGDLRRCRVHAAGA